MNIRNFFPLSKASGKAFCNRIEENKWLLENIEACKHSLLVAPRRFGKSSLAERAIENSKYPSTVLNFNICTDERDIEYLIRQGVSLLIGNALGPVDKMLHLIKSQLKSFAPKLSLGTETAGLTLELSPAKENSPALLVNESLMLLEKLLIKKNKRAILVFDEFQTVGLIAKGSGVEAAIRNSAQEMKRLTIIFSGSIRGLLQSMFEDKNKPLYKLCRKLVLKRIEAVHYEKHLNQASMLAYNTSLPKGILNTIMQLSERHPYYVNYLCDVIWTQYQKLPSIHEVQQAWKMVIEEERSDANAEIAQLSFGQRKILKYLAIYSGTNLTSANTVQIIGIGASSIAAALQGLLEKDIIEKVEDNYIIINPIIHQLFKEFGAMD